MSGTAADPGLRAALVGPPRVRRRLARLPERPLNYDRAQIAGASLAAGWTIDDIRHPLGREAPGPPADRGPFSIARRLIGGYEFADPSIVRAFYDPRDPLEGRNMLLRLRALGVFQVYAGVRILEVVDAERRHDGRAAQVWGWRYGTLQGHLEMGEMSWEVWKWLATGEIEFRIHAVSRRAAIANPVVRLGFTLVGPHERRVFLRSTCERMQRFTELALEHGDRTEPVRAAAAELIARPMARDAAHEQVARNLDVEP